MSIDLAAAAEEHAERMVGAQEAGGVVFDPATRASMIEAEEARFARAVLEYMQLAVDAAAENVARAEGKYGFVSTQPSNIDLAAAAVTDATAELDAAQLDLDDAQAFADTFPAPAANVAAAATAHNPTVVIKET